jgi:hypothetical protein
VEEISGEEEVSGEENCEKNSMIGMLILWRRIEMRV